MNDSGKLRLRAIVLWRTQLVDSYTHPADPSQYAKGILLEVAFSSYSPPSSVSFTLNITARGNNDGIDCRYHKTPNVDFSAGDQQIFESATTTTDH